ncbi:uncharacterized protein Triagg1_6422 [Trichoderma aggressivum f. europaeum]|uniref:non-specific serine/threonine protein kinase n=1 Tax=Trichoderma aggressivum f. europaeum TaxID=173218 RepID=A0AAE1IDT3_9HYPO|nr:hypothetical protein Triagg1_6422 [Trichoderma aggressivum f. europaeum]
MDEARLKIIEEHPIGGGLDSFRALFASTCESLNLAGSLPNANAIDQLEQLGQLEQLDQEALQKLTLTLFTALQLLKAVQLLRSAGRGQNLLSDILQFIPTIVSLDFDFDRVKALLQVALNDNSHDVLIWGQVYSAVTEVTPPPPPPQVRWSSVTDTPITRNTSSILNSSELRREVDQVLKEEIDPRVGIRKFRKSFFASVPRLEEATDAVLRKCSEGEEPLFGREGWVGWPAAAAEQDVLAWLCSIVPKLQSLAVDFTPATVTQRKLLAQPKTPLLGSTGRRSMDVGFVNNDVVYHPYAGKSGRYRWSHVLVPGELKSNPMADAPPVAWIDLATYAREVLSAQDTRRFVLAFSLCGSLMRLWEYDRLGGIASEQFDINDSKGALEFVATMLGFLWMDEERLGFDPTIQTSDGKRFIEIERNSRPERLIIDEVIARSRCIAGRATTCWKAHLEDDQQTAFVIKDSWQYPERDDEGEILQEVTQRGVTNVARYYHHETVRIRDVDDDVRNGVRTGLDITTADAPTATADAMTTPDSTATTVMADATTAGDATATATADSTAITAVVEKAHVASTSTTVDAAAAVNATDTPDALTVDDTAATATTMTMARRASASSISTASTIAVAAPRRRRSTAQRGKKTPRVQQLRQSESRSGKKNHGSGSNGSSGSIDSIATTDSTGGAGTKRRSSQVNEAEERPVKRSRSESQSGGVDKTPPNRIHRRIIVQDYGRPIYKASSPAALVAAVESCIQGHESLRKAGFLHRDISVNNVLIDEREGAQKGFLIDLDLAIRESRKKASGAKGKTGTRAFMAIGLLFGEPHCFMHDLESFFWVLFWVCVNHDGPDRSVKKNLFDHWNYAKDYELAGSKLGVITDSFIFRKRAGECFTAFYEPLIPMMDRLREVVFPGGLRWKQVDEGLYSRMRDILRDGEKE